MSPDSDSGPHAGQAQILLQLQLLGKFDLTIDGKSHTANLTYDKPKLLLAILALSNGMAWSRSQLATLLWPDIPEPQGKARMRHALHVLRQALSAHPQVLQSQGDALSLDMAHVEVDALDILHEPETLGHAMRLALYRGPLLHDLRARLGDELNAWLEQQSLNLDQRLAQCRSGLAAACMEKQQYQQMRDHARRWVTLWPEDEETHHQLIQALVLCREHEAAREAYERCAAMLASQLGTEPSPETRALLDEAASSNQPVLLAPQQDFPFWPLAVLTVLVHWRVDDACHLEHETALPALAQLHQTIQALTERHGGWQAAAYGNQHTIYFGFPGQCERPLRDATDLALAISALPVTASLAISCGVHADIGRCTPGVRPDNGFFLAQTSLALALAARNREVLLSRAAACRTDDCEITEVQRNGTAHLLLQSRRPLEVSRMHGRVDEFATLVHAWRQVRNAGQPALHVLNGPPGSGKTLLATALAQHAHKTDANTVWLQCRQEQHARPLHPLRAWLQARVTTECTDSEAFRQTPWQQPHLERHLRLPPDVARALAHAMRTQETTGRTLLQESLMASICEALARQTNGSRPLLIVIDDAHWADAHTLVLANRLARENWNRPVMILVTLRGRLRSLPAPLIELGRLRREAVTELVIQRSRTQKRLDKTVRNDIIAHGCDTPGYINAMLSAAIYQGSPCQPAALLDAVCARMAVLEPSARALLRLSALCRTPIDAATAARLLELPQEDVGRLYAELSIHGLVHACGNGQWQCGTMLAGLCLRLTHPQEHRQLSQLLANDLLSRQCPPEQIAPFLHQAQDPRAALWWRYAAEEAMAQNRQDDALRLLSQAISLLDSIADLPQRDRFAFECYALHGAISAAQAGAAQQETEDWQEPAASTTGDEARREIVALWGQWLIAQNAGAHQLGLRLARQLMQIAGTQQPCFRAWACYALAQHFLWSGQGRDAERLLTFAEHSLDGAQDMPELPYGSHSSALIPCALALALGLQGKFEDAHVALDRALFKARETASPVNLLFCQLVQTRLCYLQDDTEAAGKHAENCLTLAPASGMLAPWRGIATGYAMLPRVLRDADAQALAAMEAALPTIRQGMPVAVDGHLCLLARACIAIGRAQDALALLDEAEELGSTHGLHSLAPEIQCLRGDAWLQLGDRAQARELWQAAQQLAKELDLVPYILWAQQRLRSARPLAVPSMTRG